MVNNALSICAYNRCAVDALKVPEQLMPPIVRALWSRGQRTRTRLNRII